MASIASLSCAVGFSIAIFAQARGPSMTDAERVAMAARASGQPLECRQAAGTTLSRRSRLTIWDHARQPQLQRYCDLLGRAQAKLESFPAAAHEAALLADQVMPGQAAPWVLRARANVRLDNPKQAIHDFGKARSIEPRSIEDPLSLHDLALAQRRTGNSSDAMSTYRILVPRLGLIPNTNERVAILIEAAAIAMSRGPSGLDESLMLLMEARSLPLSVHDPFVMAMLALASDRASMRQEADALLEELHRSGHRMYLATQDPSSFRFLEDVAEGDALLALVLEREDRARAISLWERYLAQKTKPHWLEHAKERLEALRRAPARPVPR